jgi:hypothetical protein
MKLKPLQFCALWKANSLSQHTAELKTFISMRNVAVTLILEMHFTEKSYLKLPNSTDYHTNHPARTAQGETAIIIKHCIKHHRLNSYSQDFLQATTVSVEDSVGLLTILAVYLPPRNTAK